MAMALQTSMVQYFNGKKSLGFGRESKISCHQRDSHLAVIDGNICSNFYELLSLDSSKNVGLDEIKRAYRSKALKFHPDLCSPSTKEESTRRFLEIKMAYETLSDPISREIYDDEFSLLEGEGRRKHGMMMMSCRGNNINGCSREVWQRQLSGLKKRSAERLGKEFRIRNEI